MATLPAGVTQPEVDAAFKVARQQINDMAGWYASMIPDSDVEQIAIAALSAAYQVRIKGASK